MQQSSLCSRCKSDKVVTDSEPGEIICSNCGMVIADKVQDIDRSERRFFNSHSKDTNAKIFILPIFISSGSGISVTNNLFSFEY
jgi:transcription initiation factor TFIIB